MLKLYLVKCLFVVCIRLFIPKKTETLRFYDLIQIPPPSKRVRKKDPRKKDLNLYPLPPTSIVEREYVKAIDHIVS